MKERDGAEGRRTQDKNANQTQLFKFMEEQKREPYLISRHVGVQGLRSSVGNQARVEKLVIGTKTDLNFYDQGKKNGTTKQIYGAGVPPKETTVTAKEMPNFLVEVQVKVYYGLKMMARKFIKYGQVDSIAVHLKYTPTYYVN